MEKLMFFNISCKDCGNELIDISFLPKLTEIAINCGMCGSQEIIDANIDVWIDEPFDIEMGDE